MKTNNERINLANIAADNKRPALVSVLSGKGGSGKSVIAYNLADSLSRHGRRCLIIDTDWNFGNLHILANVYPKNTLLELVERQVTCAEAAIKLGNNLDLIASPAALHSGSDFKEGLLARFTDSISTDCRVYDIVILDTPSGMLDIIKLAANLSDMNLVILNPELTSIASNYGLMKLLVGLNREIIFHIFVNRAESGKDSEYIYQKLSALTGRYLRNLPYLAGYLNMHQSVVESVARQKTIGEIESEARITDQILALCKFVTEKLTADTLEGRIVADTNINSKSILVDIKE